ncbi:glycerol-3-phosphate 1-O-acyltransferase PlsY [Desulfobacterales bacterium HSG16]|nr:glycerol-3-phosphate 1-O-acyltransferase PlsY [Desulfobacterales bacterium HSG16]
MKTMDSINISWLWLPLIAYIAGSVSWGLIWTRLFTDIDIRKKGSCNIGSTNVARLAGIRLGILTLACDILKGAVPVFIAVYTGNGDFYIGIVCLTAFLGHLYPVFTGFKGGGKGVATACGCFIIVSPAAFVMIIISFIVLVTASARVSVGSIGASILLPFALLISCQSFIIALFAALVSILICIRHKDNIHRLIKGTEPAFSFTGSKGTPKK